jgi:hypothetical protein
MLSIFGFLDYLGVPMTYQEKKIDKTEDKGIRFALFEKANFEYAGT